MISFEELTAVASDEVRVFEVLCSGDNPDGTEFYYRFDDCNSESKDSIYLCRYSVVKKTKSGVWLDDLSKKGKFILNGARKRFAYPTKELALNSYKIRKRWQMRHATNTLERATTNLALAEKVKL
jgi:hypothetical protein